MKWRCLVTTTITWTSIRWMIYVFTLTVLNVDKFISCTRDTRCVSVKQVTYQMWSVVHWNVCQMKCKKEGNSSFDQSACHYATFHLNSHACHQFLMERVTCLRPLTVQVKVHLSWIHCSDNTFIRRWSLSLSLLLLSALVWIQRALVSPRPSNNVYPFYV